MSKRIEELLELAVVELRRGASAQEDLIKLATEERDYGDSLTVPPVCPACNMINPKIVVMNHQQPADLSEFVLVANCQHCHHVFYAVPASGFMPFVDADAAAHYLSERGVTTDVASPSPE